MRFVAFASSDEMPFMIKKVFSYNCFGHDVWITTSHICLLIVVVLLMAFCIFGGRAVTRAATSKNSVPKGFANAVEMIVEMLDNMIKGTMGKHAPVFANYIGTIFMFIFISNISGLLGLRPPTADYGVTLPLGILTFCMIHFVQFKHQKPKAIWTDFCSPLPPWLPIWLPINLISELAVPISLSLRLFANVLSGTIMMALIYTLLGKIAIIWPGALHAYFDIFSGAIQTYVFCMLTMTYITNAYADEE